MVHTFVIKVMQTTLKFAAKHGNLQIFSKCLETVADMYVSNRDFVNGLSCYNQLRLIAEASVDHRMKINSLMQIADICRILQKYETADIFLKKALQYVFYINDTELETYIYDKLGMLNYLMCKIDQAKYFHKRSMNQLYETENSPVKRHAIETTKQHLKEVVFHTTNINKTLLTRLGLLGEEFESSANLKIGSRLTTAQQLEAILQDHEFQTEITNPQQPIEAVTNDGIIKEENFKYFSPEIITIHRQMIKNKYFRAVKSTRSPDLEGRQQQIGITKDNIKEQIEAMIQRRIESGTVKLTVKFELQLESVDIFKNELQQHYHSHFQSDPNQQNLHYFNHLSPNRSIEAFQFQMRPLKPKAKNCFDELTSLLITKQSKF